MIDERLFRPGKQQHVRNRVPGNRFHNTLRGFRALIRMQQLIKIGDIGLFDAPKRYNGPVGLPARAVVGDQVKTQTHTPLLHILSQPGGVKQIFFVGKHIEHHKKVRCRSLQNGGVRKPPGRFELPLQPVHIAGGQFVNHAMLQILREEASLAEQFVRDVLRFCEARPRLRQTSDNRRMGSEQAVHFFVELLARGHIVEQEVVQHTFNDGGVFQAIGLNPGIIDG